MDPHFPGLRPRARELFDDVDSDRLSTVASVDTYDTTETESSATTIWGPGALSGRAIKSLGEASLRGVEKLMVRWRLAKINSLLQGPGPGSGSGNSLSSSKSVASGEQMEKIYDDLLELSRLDFYDAKVRQKALRLIMMQIGSRETSQLLFCVVKWPREEIRIFISEMLCCIPLLWHNDSNSLEADDKARLELIAVYRSSQSPTESHELLPFIEFIPQLAQEHKSSCRAVIESGYMDTLAAVCEQYTVDTAPSVVNAVQASIEILLGHQRGWDIVCHPRRLDLVWPRNRIPHMIPLARWSLKLTDKTPTARKEAWLASPAKPVMDRICEISVVLSMLEVYASSEKDLFDICFDLLVFCDLDIEKGNFTELAMSYLSQIIAIGGEIRLALEHVLCLLPYHPKLDFFYRIIYPLSRLQVEPIPTALKFCQEVKDRHRPDTDPIDFFVDFAMDVADGSQSSAQAILDAEIIPLLDKTTPRIRYVLQRINNAVEQHHNHHEKPNRPRAGTV